jgi:hypothetical protein
MKEAVMKLRAAGLPAAVEIASEKRGYTRGDRRAPNHARKRTLA